MLVFATFSVDADDDADVFVIEIIGDDSIWSIDSGKEIISELVVFGDCDRDCFDGVPFVGLVIDEVRLDGDDEIVCDVGTLSINTFANEKQSIRFLLKNRLIYLLLIDNIRCYIIIIDFYRYFFWWTLFFFFINIWCYFTKGKIIWCIYTWTRR